MAPKFIELTGQLLFGEIWQRPALSARERSLITVATLVAMNRLEQQPCHMARAQEHGEKQRNQKKW